MILERGGHVPQGDTPEADTAALPSWMGDPR